MLPETADAAIKEKPSKQATIKARLEALKAQDTPVERFEPTLFVRCRIL